MLFMNIMNNNCINAERIKKRKIIGEKADQRKERIKKTTRPREEKKEKRNIPRPNNENGKKERKERV